MKIAFFELEGWEELIIKQELGPHEFYFSSEELTELKLPAERNFDVISVFMDSRITKKTLEQFPNLKGIATRSTGYDHIDLAAARQRGVTVSSVPGYGSNTVAEFAFGLILNLTRKIYQAIDQIKETKSFSLTGLRGIELKGKTLGIVGTGRIGREMVGIAEGFEMNVIASDPSPDDALAKEKGFRYVSLEDLLSQADIISLHCPYTKATHHLINQKNIALVKRGAYLVNTARGGIIETQAIIEGLQEGILAGAALDVLEEEGEIKDELEFLSRGQAQADRLMVMLQNHALMKMPNVLVTPHNAFNSQEALERILRTTIENIRGFLKGKPLNVVK
ncbi:MAG: hypothetical protein A3J30_02785 [Candidatus Wildermuthbacteria bacterium RIFCSPLOWO2_02_FULL_47_9c]|uniref:D-isomer specific 2-hydroxyacid dehydrogenase NAD-binding protein n=2 Tax=Parcubacteria group TaxID=1794811 RepID=A0A837IK87_9BACT|nr:MAG: D-isomer specific 2-hydroxyacid dehydrogenase NAD-binding protein [Candidatus Yanofskybacteria bacterium GW2011_GWC1_48_11]KKW04027.1 MAG: D-isomer specific 2-hydroxyacid dehydrogenase NAD-binding protein [Parcubacteria group bacterium GW2011_GWB1_49_12]KKW08872.1 MAG: D-isomer specific 2-hydroxyacid dehydrogenase NAD-binding protein [Parcubacteria group bacterium GW2011_GWA1_49_26]KKW13726.1 MAG: D-isomer specific 2-hydroxyacid dehydrogenase NAD-binding protein [Parcubacteria group bact